MALRSPKRSRRRPADEDFDAGSPDRPVDFGDYVLLGRLGRGGMAEVYRGAPRNQPAELIAIKCMRSQLAKEDRFLDMFDRETRLAQLLRHKHIVETFDAGKAQGRYYIAMEYIPGVDLSAVLRRCRDTAGRIPAPHAIFITKAVAQALDYAHRLEDERGRPLNIVNRDVSPANIRISFDGAVKLLDFGIAQAIVQATSEIGVLKGKFAYMSPEQIRGLPIDHRSDLFSLGIAAYEMLTLTRLFADDNEFGLMEKVRQVKIQPPSAINQRVPVALDRIVLRMLARDPADRYQSAAEIAHDLDLALRSYQFEGRELGEFIRRIFPRAYRDEQRLRRGWAPTGDAVLQRVESKARSRRTESPTTHTEQVPMVASQAEKRLKLAWLSTAVLFVLGLIMLLATLF